MRIGRTLPPAATTITFKALLSGIRGLFRGQRELDQFRASLKQRFGVKHCFLVSSGQAAFTLILLALKEKRPHRREILIPAYTCYSVPAAIERAGLTVRLCDLQADRLDLDLERLGRLLAEPEGSQNGERVTADVGISSNVPAPGVQPANPGNRILAVVPTHLFGFAADIDGLRSKLRDPDIVVVEDAAQAMGEAGAGGMLGTRGDVGFFSLARGKAFSVVEGGVIVTDRDDLAETLERMTGDLPRYGPIALAKLVFKAVALMMLIHPGFFWIPRAMPFLRLGETIFDTGYPMLRMSSLQAGMARNWRADLERMRHERKTISGAWRRLLCDMGIEKTGFHYPESPGLLRFPIRIRDREARRELLRGSERLGMGVMPSYPESINCLKEMGGQFGDQQFPVAETLAKELVTLPTHRYVVSKDIAAMRRLLERTVGVKNRNARRQAD